MQQLKSQSEELQCGIKKVRESLQKVQESILNAEVEFEDIEDSSSEEESESKADREAEQSVLNL